MLTMLQLIKLGITNKGHLLQGLVVLVSCVQFESRPYPFRVVLMFNVRFGVVTLHKATQGGCFALCRITTPNRTLNIKPL